MEFLCNGLRPVVDGKIKPDQLEALLEVELDAKANEADEPVHILQLVGDSLPGRGVTVAVGCGCNGFWVGVGARGSSP